MSAFGELTSTSKSPWIYSGKRFDAETGFYYFGRRYLDPQLGRWITKDPLGYADGLNLYAYVHNRPLTHIDPDGQFAFLIPIALSLAAEYTVPFAAVALQEAGYITAAAFLTGVVQGYNGSILEGSPLESLDANAALAGGAGKALGFALSCANPRKGLTNIARTALTKEVTVVSTNVVNKAANKWYVNTFKQATAHIKPDRANPYKPFIKKNTRENLKTLTGITPDSTTQAHHVFPQYRKKFFADKDINIHDPKYMTWWKSPDHQKNAYGYNKEWEKFIQSTPNPTKYQVLDQGRIIMNEYGIKVNY